MRYMMRRRIRSPTAETKELLIKENTAEGSDQREPVRIEQLKKQIAAAAVPISRP